MKLLHQITQDNENLKTEIISFINQYGITGLQEAMQLYINLSQDYICRTKRSIQKVKIRDIYYLTIRGHNITIHTENRTCQKYGTLQEELILLSPYGFLKCNQSCIVSVSKIKEIENNTLILDNNDKLHISRTCAAKILSAFNCAVPTLYPERP